MCRARAQEIQVLLIRERKHSESKLLDMPHTSTIHTLLNPERRGRKKTRSPIGHQELEESFETITASAMSTPHLHFSQIT